MRNTTTLDEQVAAARATLDMYGTFNELLPRDKDSGLQLLDQPITLLAFDLAGHMWDLLEYSAHNRTPISSRATDLLKGHNAILWDKGGEMHYDKGTFPEKLARVITQQDGTDRGSNWIGQYAQYIPWWHRGGISPDAWFVVFREVLERLPAMLESRDDPELTDKFGKAQLLYIAFNSGLSAAQNAIPDIKKGTSVYRRAADTILDKPNT